MQLQFRACPVDRLVALGLAQFLQDDVAEILDPVIGVVARYLKMALKAIGGVAMAERLIGGGGAGHQPGCPWRQGKGIFMKLHDVLAWAEIGQQRILFAFRRDLDRQEAEFEIIVHPHLGAEGPRQQLAAETKTQQRLALAMKGAQEITGGSQGRIAGIVMRVLRTTMTPDPDAMENQGK